MPVNVLQRSFLVGGGEQVNETAARNDSQRGSLWEGEGFHIGVDQVCARLHFAGETRQFALQHCQHRR